MSETTVGAFVGLTWATRDGSVAKGRRYGPRIVSSRLLAATSANVENFETKLISKEGVETVIRAIGPGKENSRTSSSRL